MGGKSTKMVVDPHRNVSILIDPNSRDNPNGARLWARIIRIILKKIWRFPRYGTPSHLFFPWITNNLDFGLPPFYRKTSIYPMV